MTLALAAAAGITFFLNDQLGGGTRGGDQVIDDPVAGSGAATGQVIVTGSVTALRIDEAVLEPRELPVPLTVVSERGFGNGGEFSAVGVDGQEASVVWDGGRPLVISSGGSLVLDPVAVELVPEGLRLVLGGAVHALTPGTYQVDTPVAVGSSGVASARSSATFEAGGQSTFVARGDAAVVLPPDTPRHLLGPGTVHLEGDLTVIDEDGEGSATTLDAESDAFDIVLTPKSGGGWSIRATLQGKTTST